MSPIDPADYVEPLGKLGEQFVPRTSPQQARTDIEPVYSMSHLLRLPEVEQKLLSSNILIFGVVGFFDPICKALSSFYYQHCNKQIELKRAYSATKFPKRDGADKQTPLLILPTAENHKAFNQIVANILHLERPTWIVALPSQLDTHLFSSFNCFFVSSRPLRELKSIANVTPIMEADVLKLQEGKIIKAILSTDTALPNLGVSDRMGTVLYINQLDAP